MTFNCGIMGPWTQKGLVMSATFRKGFYCSPVGRWSTKKSTSTCGGTSIMANVRTWPTYARCRQSYWYRREAGIWSMTLRSVDIDPYGCRRSDTQTGGSLRIEIPNCAGSAVRRRRLVVSYSTISCVYTVYAKLLVTDCWCASLINIATYMFSMEYYLSKNRY